MYTNSMIKILGGFILALLVAGGVYVGVSIGERAVQSHMAEKRGVTFISKLYAEYTIAGQNCQGEDTDGDSYISCDFRIKNAAGEDRVVHLQCPTISKALLGDTCKEARAVISQ
jgi:hypothetical protein